jgi:hypothetical protein
MAEHNPVKGGPVIKMSGCAAEPLEHLIRTRPRGTTRKRRAEVADVASPDPRAPGGDQLLESLSRRRPKGNNTLAGGNTLQPPARMLAQFP